MPSTRLRRSGRTTKSSPRSMKARTGACTSFPTRRRVRRTSRPVRSGFCSLPDRANSRRMMARLSTNHVYGYPMRVMCRSVPRASAPGTCGKGSRRPVGSSHRLLGPGRMRMPCRAQMGFQLRSPSV